MISGMTRIYGIFGYPVEHTFSPAMHNAAFKKMKLNSCYVPFAVHPARLAAAAKAVIPLNLQGLNVTVPHKEKIIPYLDGLSEEARLIGAVNTIEVKEGKLIGHNTDGRGFLRSLKEQARFNPRGKKFVCIGSGGAARAVGFSLALAGASGILFRDIDSKKASTLARDIERKTGVPVRSISQDALEASTHEADCIINATPLGLKKGDTMPVPDRFIQSKHLVCDLVYNPPATALLKAARAKKATTLEGLGMLLFQGVIAFEIWTGEKAPVAVMKAALIRQIGF
jgi:shikimate dehydrogenase